MGDDGHRYKFGPPAGGWPDFSVKKTSAQIKGDQCRGQLELPLDDEDCDTI